MCALHLRTQALFVTVLSNARLIGRADPHIAVFVERREVLPSHRMKAEAEGRPSRFGDGPPLEDARHLESPEAFVALGRAPLVVDEPFTTECSHLGVDAHWIVDARWMLDAR